MAAWRGVAWRVLFQGAVRLPTAVTCHWPSSSAGLDAEGQFTMVAVSSFPFPLSIFSQPRLYVFYFSVMDHHHHLKDLYCSTLSSSFHTQCTQCNKIITTKQKKFKTSSPMFCWIKERERKLPHRVESMARYDRPIISLNCAIEPKRLAHYINTMLLLVLLLFFFFFFFPRFVAFALFD